jgi:hypothetical protein
MGAVAGTRMVPVAVAVAAGRAGAVVSTLMWRPAGENWVGGLARTQKGLGGAGQLVALVGKRQGLVGLVAALEGIQQGVLWVAQMMVGSQQGDLVVAAAETVGCRCRRRQQQGSFRQSPALRHAKCRLGAASPPLAARARRSL